MSKLPNPFVETVWVGGVEPGHPFVFLVQPQAFRPCDLFENGYLQIVFKRTTMLVEVVVKFCAVRAELDVCLVTVEPNIQGASCLSNAGKIMLLAPTCIDATNGFG